MSTNRRIYLDYNATAPLLPAARDAMVEAMGDVGNPSSIHAEGRRMRDRVEKARNQIATLLGRPREQVIFTSGGTEANWLGVMALAAAAEARGLPRVVATTPLEHPSLRGAIEALRVRGWQVATLHADRDHGVVEVRRAEAEAADGSAMPRIGLLAAGLVNHEIGTILGDDILRWARELGALVHLDAVQAAGKLPTGALATDSIAISGHKLGGPQGIGALALSIDTGLPLVEGGHQERGRRPGTENALGIVGFGAAVAALASCDPASLDLKRMGEKMSEKMREELLGRASGIGTWLEAGMLGGVFEKLLQNTFDRVRIHGRYARRVESTLNVAFEGALGESIVMGLDLEGISVSTGAACTSGSIQPSPVLLGLGYAPDEAREAVRFSLGPQTTFQELRRVVEVLPGIVERARRHR